MDKIRNRRAQPYREVFHNKINHAAMMCINIRGTAAAQWPPGAPGPLRRPRKNVETQATVMATPSRANASP